MRKILLFVAVGLLGACTEDDRGSSPVRKALSLPPARWVAGYEGPVASDPPVATTLERISAAVIAAHEARAEAHSFAAWRNKLYATRTGSETLVIGIVNAILVDDPLDGKREFDFTVEERLTGPELPDVVHIIQARDEIASCFDLAPKVGRRYFVILRPGSTSTFEVLMDFGTGFYGWGLEEASGTFSFEAGPQGVAVNDLRTL